MAKGYYDQWFGLAVSSRMGFQFFYQAKQYPDAAYNLQQACERLYSCILLVFTFYTPYSHNIKFLRQLAARLSPKLIDAWPRAKRKLEGRFLNLQAAYVTARHSDWIQIGAATV